MNDDLLLFITYISTKKYDKYNHGKIVLKSKYLQIYSQLKRLFIFGHVLHMTFIVYYYLLCGLWIDVFCMVFKQSNVACILVLHIIKKRTISPQQKARIYEMIKKQRKKRMKNFSNHIQSNFGDPQHPFMLWWCLKVWNYSVFCVCFCFCVEWFGIYIHYFTRNYLILGKRYH